MPTMAALRHWAEQHLDEVEEAQRRYDDMNEAEEQSYAHASTR